LEARFEEGEEVEEEEEDDTFSPWSEIGRGHGAVVVNLG